MFHIKCVKSVKICPGNISPKSRARKCCKKTLTIFKFTFEVKCDLGMFHVYNKLALSAVPMEGSVAAE